MGDRSAFRSTLYLLQDATIIATLYALRPYFCFAWWAPTRLLWWNLVRRHLRHARFQLVQTSFRLLRIERTLSTLRLLSPSLKDAQHLGNVFVVRGKRRSRC